VLQISLGTVKSRLIRGRDALKKRLESFVREMGTEVGGTSPARKHGSPAQSEVEAQS
jgi:hypothetical protein